MQLSGEALRIGVRDLNDRIALDRPMHGQLLRFVHTAILQRDETAFSASRASMEQRVARWLLMAQDRMRSEDIELTQELMATMLGVRRAGVSGVKQGLWKSNIIVYGRRSIRIMNRPALEKLAAQFYGISEAEFERLLPPSTH